MSENEIRMAAYEATSGKFPWYVATDRWYVATDRFGQNLMESECQFELAEWRHAFAHRKRLQTLGAKQRYRKTLEHTFDALKSAYLNRLAAASECAA